MSKIITINFIIREWVTQNTLTNTAEISRDFGNDIDSRPDTDSENDCWPINDKILGTGKEVSWCDEDDHDSEVVKIEFCDGRDNTNDGVIDEGYENMKEGMECNDWKSATRDDTYNATCECIWVPVEEVCNGKDDDNDGKVDEWFDDMSPWTACDDGDDATSWDIYNSLCECVWMLDQEICNGEDDDNDGQIDEWFEDMAEWKICDDWDSSTINDIYTKNCTCRWTPTKEICNGVDDDADGEIDEWYGDKDWDGIKDCLDEEECDGIDNDGDGHIDNGLDCSEKEHNTYWWWAWWNNYCGDGNTMRTEECDDGNNIDGDGCDKNCYL